MYIHSSLHSEWLAIFFRSGPAVRRSRVRANRQVSQK